MSTSVPSRVKIKHSDTNTVPIIIVCTDKKQAIDVNRLNDLAGDSVQTAKAGLPKIKAFLEGIEVEGSDPALLGKTGKKWYAVWDLQKEQTRIQRTIFANYG